MTLTDLLVPTYRQMLRALSGWLDKGQAHISDDTALLSARLAPDMFPLATQVRFCCVQAHEGVKRLTGAPLGAAWQTLLDEGRDAMENPGSVADAQARIAETLRFLETVAPDALDQDPSGPIAHELPNGMVFDLTRAQYARDWALPQFYFHLMTAYAILRNQGVDLGKVDYVQHMFAYLRPGTLPDA